MPKNENVTMLVSFPSLTKYGRLQKCCAAEGIAISSELVPHEKQQHQSPDQYAPQRGDPKEVKLILAEAVRLREFAFRLVRAGQHDSANVPLHMANAYQLTAAWLRCELKGDFKGYRAEMEAAKKKAKK